MRFDIATIVVSALASIVAAVPNPHADSHAVAPRADMSVTSYNDLLASAAANTSCNLFDCLVPIVTLGCVALNIEAKNEAGATGCVIGGAQAVCACLDCIPVAGDWLQSHGYCPS